ncbi:MAG: hypothetical protein KGJ62_06505 [Armatimonadetes bacterium]|nr:hypothetical protein [Armatimonadota bacterium]MDE2207271.1 hypothetical protein [Armatimonadota bacterium]
MPTAVRETAEAVDALDALALTLVGDQVYHTVLELYGIAKTGDIARSLNNSAIDARLCRVALVVDRRIRLVDRKWCTRASDVPRETSVHNAITGILEEAGVPLAVTLIASQLRHIYGRPVEVLETMLERLASTSRQFFVMPGGELALGSWLLNTECAAGMEPEAAWDQILFENFLEDEPMDALLGEADALGWQAAMPDSTARLVDDLDRPVSNKVLQALSWRHLQAEFDAEALYQTLWLAPGISLLSSGHWIGSKLRTRLEAEFARLSELEVSEAAEAEAEQAARPLELTPDDRERIVRIILDSETSVPASQILEDVFEITPDYRIYPTDMKTVIGALQEDKRISWVGADRFVKPGVVPPYVFGVPQLLRIPDTAYLDAEGQPVDILLHDEGLEAGLQREILDPFCQDVLDEEAPPPPDPNPPTNARAVVKYHHKQLGTMPMCQFPSGFFPPEPSIIEATFLLGGGHRVQVYINNETRLAYGLLDWFKSIPMDSGATFMLEREAPDRYRVSYNDESEHSLFISRNRLTELLELQQRADAEGMPAFNIVREILEHNKKGTEFGTLFAELNVVRRVRRRLTASLLSEYQCFVQRGNGWVFDLKKLPQGFDKSKRKYVAKVDHQ